MTKTAKRYVVASRDAEGRPVGGLDLPGGVRAEPGDVVSVPARSASWLLEQGYIAIADEEA